jgi:ABC-type lipoprotein release transport system permease subunit
MNILVKECTTNVFSLADPVLKHSLKKEKPERLTKHGGNCVLSYALKRVTRSTWLFAALLLGVVLASTFFAGINVGADTTAKAALDQQLDQMVVDLTASSRFRVPLSSANWVTASERLTSVEGVVEGEVVTRALSFFDSNETDPMDFNVIGISENSRVYDGLTVVSGASSLQANETYVWVGARDADKIELNDVLTVNYLISPPDSEPRNLSLSLTVVGFVDLDEDALSLASGEYSFMLHLVSSGIDLMQLGHPSFNLLITDWEKTCAGLVDTFYSSEARYSPLSTEIMGFIDRKTVINPWSVDSSQDTLKRMVLQIDNELAEFGLTTYCSLDYTLSRYMSISMNMRFTFLVMALPVFFVAWYVGSTVSRVSFNLRRREIGLLSAKGFSSGQLFRLFLSESLVIGIVGGLIGVGLSYVLSPSFIPNLGIEFGAVPPVLTNELIILVLVFSTGLTLLSTFSASRRSAKLSTIDALREHMYVEETKAYKQKLPLAALFLGSYKIGLSLLGITSLLNYFGGSPPMPSNIFLTILFGGWLLIDAGLTPFAPLFFFWGFTKVFVCGSKGFQKLVTVFSRFLGDIGTLATKNVKRNPVRVASVAFLVALVIGYGFLTVGTLASEEDYIVRQVQATVGADIKVSLNSAENASAIISNITALQGVSSTTLEYHFEGKAGTIGLSMVGVEPQEWLNTAYYENEWFSRQSVTKSFQEMAADNNTIVLARGIADMLALQLNDYIAVIIDDTITKLRVVGFFGLESAMERQLWSYVPYNFYNSSGALGSARILVNLEPNVDGASVADQIRDLGSDDISGVSSASEQLANQETDLTLSGSINVQRIGVIFTVVAASVATALVALVSLQERKKEVAIMNIRGLSFKQIATMLLAESLSVVIFAIVIGSVVGIIIANGNVLAITTDSYTSLVSHRLVFPPDAILTLAVSVLLVLLSTLLPIILVTRRYVSNLERIVRS